MEKVYVGKIVSTHGIKGEIRILSSFPFKEKVFCVGKNIIIDNSIYTIQSYRVHKKYDMITLEGFCDINDVLFLMKKKVYVSKESLELDEDEILDDDLLEFSVYTEDGDKGTIQEIFYASPDNKILRVMFNREVLVPMSSPLIKEIHKDEKKIVIQLIDGM